MSPPTLLAVPNVSEGARPRWSRRSAGRSLDEDGPDEGARSCWTSISTATTTARSSRSRARQGTIAEAMLRCGREAVERIDVMAGGGGQHPHVGALDVAPVVYLRPDDRGAACAEALVIAERLGDELDVPVFLYGELTADEVHAAAARATSCGAAGPRCWLRACAGLWPRDGAAGGGEPPLRPDFGPAQASPPRRCHARRRPAARSSRSTCSSRRPRRSPTPAASPC